MTKLLILLALLFRLTKCELIKPWSPQVCSSIALFQPSFYSSSPSAPPYIFYPITRAQLDIIETVNISSKCLSSLEIFYQNYQARSIWAYRLLDSCGQPPSGLLAGNTFFWGSYDQCVETKVNSAGIQFSGTFWRNIVSCTGKLYRGHRITESLWDQRLLELCVPSTCNEDDIEAILSDKRLNPGLFVLETNKIESYNDLPFDWSELFILFCFTCLGTLLIMATFFDSFLSSSELNTSESASQLSPFLYCFSLRRNYNLIVHGKSLKDEINCLYGWRTLSIVIVILGHVCMIGSDFNSINREAIASFIGSRWFQIVSNGSLWTDTFFVLSGFLIAHSSLRRVQENVVQKSPIHQVKIFIREVLHSSFLRYIRLTPTLIWMIMCFLMARRLGDGPHWDFLVVSLYTTVRRDIWKSLTYTINLFDIGVNPITGLIATWFLSADFQFFIASSLTLFLINGSKPRLGWCLNGFIMISSILITAWLTYKNNYPPALLFDRLFEEDYFQHIYVKPWTRISAYCIGIFLHGIWLKYRHVKIRKALGTICLATCLTFMSVMILSARKWYRDEEASKLETVLYGSLHRPIWSICVSYLIFTAASGNSNVFSEPLSWSGFRILAKLAYQAFYWHLFVIYFILGYTRTPLHVNVISFALLIITTLVVSFFLSFFSVMMFELPFIHLISLYRRDKSESELTDNNNNNNNGLYQSENDELLRSSHQEQIVKKTE